MRRSERKMSAVTIKAWARIATRLFFMAQTFRYKERGNYYVFFMFYVNEIVEIRRVIRHTFFHVTYFQTASTCTNWNVIRNYGSFLENLNTTEIIEIMVGILNAGVVVRDVESYWISKAEIAHLSNIYKGEVTIDGADGVRVLSVKKMPTAAKRNRSIKAFQ